MFTEKEFKELENELEVSMNPAKAEGQETDEGIIEPLLHLGLAFIIAVVGVRIITWIFIG